MEKRECFSVLCRIAMRRYMEGLHEVIMRTKRAMLGITNVVVVVVVVVAVVVVVVVSM